MVSLPIHLCLENKKGNFKKILKSIATEVKGPISAEVTATQSNKMIEEAKILQKSNFARACQKNLLQIFSKGIKTNVTLVFSAGQALLAAKAGATFISPFIGRLDDIGENGDAVN